MSIFKKNKSVENNQSGIKKNNNTSPEDEQLIDQQEIVEAIGNYQNKKLYNTVSENIEFIKRLIGESWDLSTREVVLVNEQQKIKIGIVFFAGLADQTFVSETILETLSNNFKKTNEKIKPENSLIHFKNNLLTMAGVEEADDFGKLLNLLLNGDTILLIDDIQSCLVIGSRKMFERAVSAPETNVTVKGSKDSFNENLLTNISLIRRRVRNPNLWAISYIIGKNSNTNVVMMYIKGLAEDKLVKEVESRIKKIETDSIVTINYMKYFLREKQFSIFPLIYDTERPDDASACLFEGKVLVLIDGSPFILVAPNFFINSMVSMDDFHNPSYAATFFRTIRLIAFYLSILLPGIYLAIIMYHSELFPIFFLFSVAGQRVDVPFPAFVEVLIMSLAFDFLRESGARMPSALGSTLSFVGAIIIGQAAVQAGLISAIIVIVISITGVAGLIIADYDLNIAVTVLRYVFIILGGLFGLFGMVLGIIVLLTHLVSLRSFGVAYFAPFAPFKAAGLKDTFFRAPIGKLFKTKKSITEKYPE